MQIAHTGTTPNVFQYSGEWLDSNVGLYYLRARYFNEATGRFWARDPVEGRKCCGLSFNPYIYTRDNPVNFIDPTGHELFEEIFLLQKSLAKTTLATIVISGAVSKLLLDLGQNVQDVVTTGSNPFHVGQFVIDIGLLYA